jgi:hypothetical protein
MVISRPGETKSRTIKRHPHSSRRFDEIQTADIAASGGLIYRQRGMDKLMFST